ncbi:DUF4275 family protein [Alkalicoccus daliensis]|uniref:DUF4275 family protein n=1 Tax=Alkalicoccus daliensis TaxID=745820 RepID=A0A1H0CXB3_9BACI|nr:DUF4275 family protein [Alkalicoccus daliensis]SDN62550.1 protein of unknown function [Alkalicoccus daliensis]
MPKKRMSEKTQKQVELLKVKNILVVCLEAAEAEELRKNWEGAFTKNITRFEKNQIHFNGMFWHIFSYNKVSSLTGKEARAAFNQQKKKKCFLFYQEEKSAFFLDNASALEDTDIVNKLNGFIDVYIVSADFKWTYVITHETEFGPYFYKN